MNENEVGKIHAVGSEPVHKHEANPPADHNQASRLRKAVETHAPTASLNVEERKVSFHVDGSNNDVTITVSEKESGRVIRTIPFEKMRDVSAGELFQYSQ